MRVVTIRCQSCNQVVVKTPRSIHNHIDWCFSNQKWDLKFQGSTHWRVMNTYRVPAHIMHYSAHTTT